MKASRIVKSMNSTSSYWMRTSYGFYRNGSRWSTALWYGKWAYSARNDINTEYLFFVSLKTTKKEREKKGNSKSTHTQSRSWPTGSVNMIGTTVLCQHLLADVVVEIKHAYYIHYKTADNSASSGLYEDFLLVNLSFTEQLSLSIFGIFGFFWLSGVPFFKA